MKNCYSNSNFINSKPSSNPSPACAPAPQGGLPPKGGIPPHYPKGPTPSNRRGSSGSNNPSFSSSPGNGFGSQIFSSTPPTFIGGTTTTETVGGEGSAFYQPWMHPALCPGCWASITQSSSSTSIPIYGATSYNHQNMMNLGYVNVGGLISNLLGNNPSPLSSFHSFGRPRSSPGISVHVGGNIGVLNSSSVMYTQNIESTSTTSEGFDPITHTETTETSSLGVERSNKRKITVSPTLYINYGTPVAGGNLDFFGTATVDPLRSVYGAGVRYQRGNTEISLQGSYGTSPVMGVEQNSNGRASIIRGRPSTSVYGEIVYTFGGSSRK